MSTKLETALSIWGMVVPGVLFFFAFFGIFTGSWHVWIDRSPFMAFVTASSFLCAVFMLAHYTVAL